jgi:hypothetical protein
VRLHEALVTAALYLDARELKSARNVQDAPFKAARVNPDLRLMAGRR